MTISAYQIDNVIKAYSKQDKSRLRFEMPQEATTSQYTDVVTLSRYDEVKSDVETKISYNVVDILTNPNRFR